MIIVLNILILIKSIFYRKLKNLNILPNKIILTPEEFKQDPDLLELFGITDIDNNLDLTIETNEHLEYLEYQEAVAD